MTVKARQKAYTASHAPGIADLASALADPRQRIEAAFVDVGGRLMQSNTLLNRITAVFEALPRDLESPEMTEATDRLAAVGQRAQDIALAFAAEQGDIAKLVSVVVAADHPISDLRRTVKMMGIVAVNARVVAAGIVGDSDDFDVFTTDITTLSDGAARTIQEFSSVYQQLTGEVHKAAAQRDTFDATHGDTLSGLAARLDKTLAEVTRHREASAEGSAETGRVSRQIATRIASAVMALQVGDATRQRIEHIEAALLMLADAVDEEAMPEGMSADDLPAARAAISALAGAQLAGASQSFGNDIGEASGALRDLAADARVIMSRSKDIYGQGGNGNSSLSSLGVELRRAAGVLRDCETERSKLEQVSTAVQGTVATLLGHVTAVQEIEANMRLVSLNAAVKCAQLGPRGAALNVIARQLRELTGETVEAAHAAMQGLTEAAALASAFGASSSGDNAGQVARLEQEAVGAIDLLEAVDARLSEALSILNRDGPAAVTQLASAATGFADHSGISEAMDDLQISITALADEEMNLRAAGKDCKPLLRQIYRSYTMEAERRTHQDLFGVDAEAPVPAAANDTSFSDDGLFSDDDGLFGDDAPAAPAPAAAATEEGGLDDIFF